RQWIPDLKLPGVGEVVEYPDVLHAALAVAHDHGPQTFLLVIPGDHAGDHSAVFVTAERPSAIIWIADTHRGITHPNQEMGKGNHSLMNRTDAAMDVDDPGSGRIRKHFENVLCRHVQRIERENPLLPFRRKRVGAQSEMFRDLMLLRRFESM